MDSEVRLGAHEGHALRIARDGDQGISTLECDTCGEVLIEQFDDGMVLFG